MKVLTYNIHSVIGADGVSDWKRCCEKIRSFAPDLVALEEVTVNHRLSPGVDVTAEFAQTLGMNGIFGEALKTGDGKGRYGVAALSRWKLEKTAQFSLPRPDESIEPRICLILKVDAPRPFYFAVTHFSYQGEFEGDAQYRLDSIRRITEKVRENRWFPIVLGGDLNNYAGTPSIDELHAHWDVWNDAIPDVPTADCSHAGWRQIDFLASFPRKAFSLEGFGIDPDLTVSDHKAVWAELHQKAEERHE